MVAGGEAQFASGGSFSEVINFASANDAELVAVVVEGRTPIDALILKPGTAETLEDLDGSTIGVKGTITTAVAAMLAGAGLVEGEDYDTVLLDGFDPVAHIALDGIDGFPGYKSNEPGTLDRAGHRVRLVRPCRLRRSRVVRRDLHDSAVPRRAPHGGAGLRAGDDARSRRRDR